MLPLQSRVDSSRAAFNLRKFPTGLNLHFTIFQASFPFPVCTLNSWIQSKLLAIDRELSKLSVYTEKINFSIALLSHHGIKSMRQAHDSCLSIPVTRKTRRKCSVLYLLRANISRMWVCLQSRALRQTQPAFVWQSKRVFREDSPRFLSRDIVHVVGTMPPQFFRRHYDI